MLEINIDDKEVFQEFIINLDNVDYIFELQYIQRLERYFINIYDADKNLIIAGLKVLTDRKVNVYVKERLFIKDLYILTLNNDIRPPKYGELGINKRCKMVYLNE